MPWDHWSLHWLIISFLRGEIVLPYYCQGPPQYMCLGRVLWIMSSFLWISPFTLPACPIVCPEKHMAQPDWLGLPLSASWAVWRKEKGSVFQRPVGFPTSNCGLVSIWVKRAEEEDTEGHELLCRFSVAVLCTILLLWRATMTKATLTVRESI